MCASVFELYLRDIYAGDTIVMFIKFIGIYMRSHDISVCIVNCFYFQI